MLGTDMHVGPVRAVAVSSDGSLIATGGTDKSIRLWKAATGEELLRLYLPLGEGNIGVVDALAFSPDYKHLYVAGIDWASPPGSSDGVAYVFDLGTGKLTGLMVWALGLGSRLATLAVSPNGAQIAMAAGSKGLLVRDTAAPGFTQRHKDPPSLTVLTSAVAYSPDGSLLATVASNGHLRLLDVSGDGDVKESSDRLLPGGGQLNSVAFSPDGAHVAVGYSDRPSILVVPLRPGAAAVSLSAPAGSSKGNLAAVTWCRDSDGQVWLFAGGTVVDLAGRNLLLAWRDGRPGPPTSMPVSLDSITRLVPHPAGGVVFGSSDPRWGRVVPNRGSHSLSLTQMQDTQRIDFRGIASRDWGIDATGTIVEFRGKRGSAAALRFDLAELTLTAVATRQSDLSRPHPVPDTAVVPPGLGFLPGSPLRSADRAAVSGHALYGGDDYLVLTDTTGQGPARCEIATAAWGVAIAGNGKVAVAAHGDGTIRWYALDQDRRLAELGGLFVNVDEQRWVAWRTDGRFAHSSRGGAKLVGFFQNGTFQPGQFSQGGITGHWLDVDQLYGRLYDPDQVRRMLSTGPADVSPSRAEIDRLELPSVNVGSICAAEDWSPQTRGVRVGRQLDGDGQPVQPTAAPSVDAGTCHSIDPAAVRLDNAIVLPAGTRALQAQLSLSAASPSTQVAAFVNGQNVGQIPVRGGDVRGVGPILVDQHVPLFPGDNQVEFRAYGTDGRSFSRAPVILRVTAPPLPEVADAPAKPALHVIVAGINQYQGTIPKLDLARADAETFAKSIQTRAARQYTLPPVVPLLDADATLEAITNQLAQVATAAQPEDAVIIYFSGHGVVGTDDQAYSFVTSDVTDANAALRGGLGMTAVKLSTALAEVRAQRTFIFLDTCHAGGFDPRAIGYLNQDTGRYVLAASTKLEEAQDSYDGINGVFAYAVKQSLEGSATTAGGFIDAIDLGRYVTSKVEEIAHTRSWEQRAVFQAAGQITVFPLFTSI